MHIIVCGAGQVGTGIVRQLTKEGNDVTVIDTNPELVAKISDSLEVKAFAGFASHPTVLEAAGAANADMIIAVTLSDEVNMIACQVANALFKIPFKIARIRHQNYLQHDWAELYHQDNMAIDVIISPELEVARTINHRLHVPGALDTFPLADGKIKVISVRCMLDSPAVHQTIDKLQQRLDHLNVALMAILREGHLLIPDDNERILPGDELYFTADSKDVYKAMVQFGHEEREARRMLIVGGGNVGLFLAQQLEQENTGLKLKLIEVKKERAEFIAERLTATTVIHGDALDQEILSEVNIANTETIVSISNDDEVNILSALLAKRLGCQRAIALINNSSTYAPLAPSLGIDVMVSPRETTVSSILQYIRRGKVRAVHTVGDGQAEVMEVEIPHNSSLLGSALGEIGLPTGVVISAILRNNEVMIPSHDTTLQSEDRVIILAKVAVIKKVEKIFSIKTTYF